MINKRSIKSLDLIEVVLILIAILLFCGIFNYISKQFTINILLYNVFIFLLMLLTSFVVAIAIFQLVKMKYIEVVKAELKADMDKYKTKTDNKSLVTNTKVVHFEVDYSKKLRKVTKDYLIKAKEIEYIKKELGEKLQVLDRKIAELEVETCLIKIEKLDEAHKIIYYKRLLELNDIYPGICEEEIINGIHITYNL